MHRYCGMDMSQFFRFEGAIEYWLLYNRKKTDGLTSDSYLQIDKKLVRVEMVDLTSCEFVLFKAGEYYHRFKLDYQYSDTGACVIDTEQALKEYAIKYKFREDDDRVCEGENIRIWVNENGFCVVKSPSLAFDWGESSVTAYYSPGVKKICNRTVKKIECKFYIGGHPFGHEDYLKNSLETECLQIKFEDIERVYDVFANSCDELSFFYDGGEINLYDNPFLKNGMYLYDEKHEYKVLQEGNSQKNVFICCFLHHTKEKWKRFIDKSKLLGLISEP